MTVYVDHARIPFRNMLMNHLMAGTPEELREIAARLGLSAYSQHPDTPKEHLDVSESKRREALRLGTREMTSRQMVEIVRRRQAGCSRQPQTRRPR